MTVRTRFSPSPTGFLHLGNARAALFSALYAKLNDGVFVLRIEDTDAARSETRFTDILQEDLHWLNIKWQEGPEVEGPYGPYWQSKRQDIYATYYKQLEEKSLVYPCFCSEQELALARKLQLSRGHAPRYSGTCHRLSKEDTEKKLAQGITPTLRFKIPENTTIEFVDLVKGPQRFSSNDIGDFIVRRADGTSPFLFCNAIDDALMKITHVLRGDDHLTNTPRQIMILQALGLPMPQYGHLSLITGDDGTPLSKRHGSFSVQDLRDKGFLPLAAINYLTRLGHTCDTQELLDFNHLAKHFKLEKLSRSPARFDQSQLMYWQKLTAQSLSYEKFWHWLGKDIEQQIPTEQREIFVEAVRPNIEFPKDALTWIEVFFKPTLSLDEEAQTLLKNTDKNFFVIALQALEKHGVDMAQFLQEVKEKSGLSGKRLFMPLRVALTGKTHGPELIHIAQLLGKEKMHQRFTYALNLHN